MPEPGNAKIFTTDARSARHQPVGLRRGLWGCAAGERQPQIGRQLVIQWQRVAAALFIEAVPKSHGQRHVLPHRELQQGKAIILPSSAQYLGYQDSHQKIAAAA